ncbi:hypothetical protein ACG7TL_006039 [Trametes sanguinea]
MAKSDNKTQGDQRQATSGNDAASFVSNTSTLVNSKNPTTSESSKKSKNKRDTTKNTALGDSATSFAKKAAEEGWSAPTATRPSLG